MIFFSNLRLKVTKVVIQRGVEVRLVQVWKCQTACLYKECVNISSIWDKLFPRKMQEKFLLRTNRRRTHRRTDRQTQIKVVKQYTFSPSSGNVETNCLKHYLCATLTVLYLPLKVYNKSNHQALKYRILLYRS